MPKFGPTGETVYARTYQRPKPNGLKENYVETMERVVEGNLGLVDERYHEEGEREALLDLFGAGEDGIIKALPAGRHLWASGVPGRQFLFNCHVAGWTERYADHFTFTFLRLSEGGGVGANYSRHFTDRYTALRRYRVHIVCDPEHPDYNEMREAGVLSDAFTHEWTGSYEVPDTREGWAEALGDLLDVYTVQEAKHEDRVYDVSRIRPKGAALKTMGGTASGPLYLAKMLLATSGVLNTCVNKGGQIEPLDSMLLDHYIAEAVVAGGSRRSARMAMLHWTDPQVFDFIRSKRGSAAHWTTNISVEIDDAFNHALATSLPEQGTLMLEDGRNASALAREVHQAVVEGMLTDGEPGYWNSSLSNEGEPDGVVCTNPCGEIPLPEWGACCLGHVNLSAFHDDPQGALEAHRLMARFLVRATFGDINDERQAEVMGKERRIGVGHFGAQGWLAKRAVRFSDSYKDFDTRFLLRSFRDAVRQAAQEYAFQLRIPEPVKVTTVAPTGTIAKIPGETEGIHPVYARYFLRRVRFSKNRPEEAWQIERFRYLGHKVENDRYAAETAVVEFPTKDNLVAQVEAMGLDADWLVQAADEVSIGDMLAVQTMWQQEYADNAVSFTVNVPAEPHQLEAMAAGAWNVPAPTPARLNNVANVLRLYLPVLKGTTLMLDGSRPQAPYERLTKEQYEAAAAETGESVDDSYDENCASGACPVR